MNEEEFSAKVTRRLDEGTDELPAATLAKLQAAREKALSQMRDGHRMPAFFSNWGRSVPVAAAVIFAAGYLLMQWFNGSADNTLHALEAELLAHELPPQAFTDEGFQQWLKNNPKP